MRLGKALAVGFAEEAEEDVVPAAEEVAAETAPAEVPAPEVLAGR
ncbi:hypothetical protein [Streptomyces morookaense]|nr:hypothetical protein [Streptomyces morookaense]GHF30897.1 hypothetical protein GCM10010359_36280 [Streptomyces morookaense]